MLVRRSVIAFVVVAFTPIVAFADIPTAHPTAPQVDAVVFSQPAVNFEPADHPTASNAEGILLSYNEEDIWERIRQGYDIPNFQSAYVAKHEHWYATRPDYIQRMVSRSERYLHFIIEEVEKRNMPSEIALLPMIESAYNPQAVSRSRAAGIWQFIPSTGKHFGLNQNWWVDHRKDVVAATHAALDYLQKLHVMFGTWDLALAAYNAGEGTVSRAIARNRSQGLPTDYASLPLSDETRNYVPKLQAMKNIISNPELYGLEIDSIPDAPYFTSVEAPEQIDATLAAELAEISLEEFTALNPEYNRPVLTASGNSTHRLLLPIHAADAFTRNLANYEEPLVTWQTYHAKRGEQVDAIARKFRISLQQLRQVNDLPASKTLNKGHIVLVPGTTTASDNAPTAIGTQDINLAVHNTSTELQPNATLRYTVKPNDTLYAIALRHQVTSKQIMQLNGLKHSRLKIGQTLQIPAGNIKTAKTQQNRNKKHYIVKRGDTLDSIAKKFDLASADIKRWNNLPNNLIRPGEKLTIYPPDEV